MDFKPSHLLFLQHLNSFRPIQYYGHPCLNLRHQNPLPQFLDRNSGLSVGGDIPSWKLDPRVLGYTYKHCRATNVPGYSVYKYLFN